MQQKVVENVEVTPEEVRQFSSIPEDDRPVFSAEVEVAQIVIEPKINRRGENSRSSIASMKCVRTLLKNGGWFFQPGRAVFQRPWFGFQGGSFRASKGVLLLPKEFKDVAFLFWKVK